MNFEIVKTSLQHAPVIHSSSLKAVTKKYCVIKSRCVRLNALLKTAIQKPCKTAGIFTDLPDEPYFTHLTRHATHTIC